MSAEEFIKRSEVSRSEYEVTPDDIIETIIKEIEEGMQWSYQNLSDVLNF